jgi:nucleotidyltransferase substrate binding protein (TIGR01987 family)
MEKDIRWEQRFNNYKKALSQLQKFIDKDTLNELEEQGLIQAFEFTHELALNVMKDYFEYQGANNIYGSRDATREAFKKGLITNGDEWMEMIKSRNESSHTYHEETIKKIHDKIFDSYYELFIEFKDKMQTLVI